MNDVCKSPEKEKVLIELTNSLSNEIIEYNSMLARLYNFKNRLKGMNPDCSEEVKHTEPTTFVEKLNLNLSSIRMVNRDFSSILNELSELL